MTPPILLLLFPILSFSLLVAILYGFSKAESQSKDLPSRFFDPRLPTEPQNLELELEGQKVSIVYHPPKPSGKTKRPPQLRVTLNIPFGSSVFLSPELKGDRFLKKNRALAGE